MKALVKEYKEDSNSAVPWLDLNKYFALFYDRDKTFFDGIPFAFESSFIENIVDYYRWYQDD